MDVVGPVGDGMLLHERDAHRTIIAANVDVQWNEVLALPEGGEATTIHSARRSPALSR
jgi:hypothetical protein